MSDGFKGRVYAEREALAEKIEKLEAFMKDIDGAGVSTAFLRLPDDEQFRLRLQLQAMCLYLDILDGRIKHFGTTRGL